MLFKSLWMMDEQEEHLHMLQKFPLLIPNNNFTEYNGYFRAGSTEFYLHVTLPNAPSLSGMVINNCSWELMMLLRDYKKDVDQWQSSSRSLSKFLEWLQRLMVTLNQCDTKPRREFPIAMWTRVYEEIKLLGLEKLCAAETESLAWLDLVLRDSAAREHKLRVKLTAAAPQFDAGLPAPSLTRVQGANSVTEAYRAFETEIEELQQFYNAMQEIDAKCWILDPSNPTPQDTKRQIQLDSGITLMLNVNPYDPLAEPELQLLGPEAKVQPLQTHLSETEWPSKVGSLLERLQTVLGITFPTREDEAMELQDSGSQSGSQLSQSNMCCVCLLATDADQSCEGCKSVFHLPCLREWLQAIPTNSKSFNRISGKCPVCQESISCLL